MIDLDDDFVVRHLPPPALQPSRRFDLAPLDYASHLNAAAELLDRHVASGQGSRRCLIDETGQWSYADLDDAAGRLAAFMASRGIGRGTRVLLRLSNSRILVALWFAILRLGAVAVTTTPMLRAGELEPIIAKARIRHGFCDVGLWADLEAVADSPLEDIVAIGDGDAFLASLPPTSVATRMLPATAPALIAFTSGSTGHPKGCVHSHRDILAIADTFSAHILQPDSDDLFCGTPPLAFTFGLGGLVVFPMRVGAAAVLGGAGPEGLAQLIERHRPTICFTAPTAYRRLAALAESYDLSSLKNGVSAGEWLSPETRAQFFEATGIQLIDGIGSTEMLHIFISAAGDAIRPGATGKPVPGFEARILGPDNLPVPTGTIGRLAVRGPTGCCYIDDPRQDAALADGWTLTGDLFFADEEGYFWYQSRADDMIVSAGHNIAAPEVERALLAHPAVADCAVASAPDVERGQAVKAFILLNPGYEPVPELTRGLQDFVKARIAPYKYPRLIDYVGVLPRSDTGKLQRFRLRG